MMQVNAYSMTVPVFVRSLANLSAILDKAVAHCEARKIDERVLLDARLFPDMFPLTKQIQLASDFARATARLTGTEPSKMEDTEASFAELKTRIERTIAEVQQHSEASLAKAAEQKIVRKMGGVDVTLDGYTYLALYMLPNFYFHAATAYNILRHNGIEIGKRDFLGAF
jgi:uncharacterized protein